MNFYWNRTFREKTSIIKKTNNTSLSRKLKNEGRINDDFEVMLSNISLEDLIGLKLEIAARSLNGFLYGIPTYESIDMICKEAVLKAVLSTGRSKVEASMFLGIPPRILNELIERFSLSEFVDFDSVEDND